jgi:hypothetical protein
MIVSQDDGIPLACKNKVNAFKALATNADRKAFTPEEVPAPN